MATSSSSLWWKQAVIYHIYARSFKDTTGNGVGDLNGIIESLDYLRLLGIGAVWISPFYPSPLKDFGYDVSNYLDVDPELGSLATFDRLVGEAHRKGLRVILDFVPNHSSDQHEWFQESQSSRDNPKRNWYIWMDAKGDGSPPNNWISLFGGPAWTWDATTEQYYLHSFLREQPDLNWRNPEVVEAMKDVLAFWLDRGVDGFRVDAVLPIIKDDEFRDNPPLANAPIGKDTGAVGQQDRVYNASRPELHRILRDLRVLVDSYPGDRIMVGEVYSLTRGIAAQYYGDHDEFHLVLNLTLVNLPWDAARMRRYIEGFEAELPAGAQPTLVLGSHDEPRIASRYGERQARVAAMMLLTHRGTPFIYYGDEIGMLDGEVLEDRVLDPWPKLSGLPHLSRDVARTPMQWNAGPGAGFLPYQEGSSPPVPWLPMHPRSFEINVDSESQDSRSIYNLHVKLIQLRQSAPALIHGDYRAFEGQPPEIYAYLREFGVQRLAIALNLGDEDLKIGLPVDGSGTVVLSSHLDRDGEVDLGDLELRAHEGLIVGLD